MIRPLRKLHLRVVLALGPVVVVLYVVALGARPPAPVADLEELLVAPAKIEAHSLVWSTTGVAGWWEETPPTVTVEVAEDLVSPEMLLYCARTASGDELPPGAWMLGEIRPGERRRVLLPGGCAPGDEILLFSLGHGAVLARAPLPPKGGAP